MQLQRMNSKGLMFMNKLTNKKIEQCQPQSNLDSHKNNNPICTEEEFFENLYNWKQSNISNFREDIKEQQAKNKRKMLSI